MNPPKISIIITSYTLDRLKDVMELIDSIQAQTYQNIETSFVAERSRELASTISRYIAEKAYPNVQVLYNEGEWGISSARNLGVEKASGDIIAFIDDDALLFPDWAEETARAYARDSSVIGVTGPILPLWEEEREMSWFPREFYWIFSCTYWDAPKTTEVRNGYGANLSFQREAFETAGLLKTHLGVRGRGQSGWQEPGAEEADFSIRVRRKTGKRIVYNPHVRVRHKVYRYRITTRFIAKRAYWEGYAKAMLKGWYQPTASERVLSTEYELLRRILCRLLPQTLLHLFLKPVPNLRKLWVISVALPAVATGYFIYGLSSLFGQGYPYGAE